MNLHMSLILILQEFGTLQTSLLKHNRRLKQRDSLPLNTVRESGRSEVPSVVQEESIASIGSLGDEVPLKLKLFAHLQLIF